MAKYSEEVKRLFSVKAINNQKSVTDEAGRAFPDDEQQFQARTVAVFLDDVINNFSEAMNKNGIIFDRRIHSFNDPLLKKTIYNMITGNLTPVGEKIMLSVKLTFESAELLNCLNENNWIIILCTDRDLRLASEITKKWLSDNHVPYLYLF